MTSDISDPSRKGAVRSYLQTASQLRAVIHQLQTEPGARLPPERELAQLLGVSRPTLREALIVLELHNEIEIRVGSGIYVTGKATTKERPAQNVASPDTASFNPAEAADPAQQYGNGHSDSAQVKLPEHEQFQPRAASAALTLHSTAEDSPKEVNQLRYFLESGIAADAARFMTASLRKKLRKSLADMRDALADSDAVINVRMAEADRLFHTTLAQSTDNQLIIQTLTSLFDQRYQPIASTMHRHFDDRQAWMAALQEHEEICQAIEAGDALQAQAAMQRHLARAHQRLMTLIG
ncbi:hypothetical protein W822_15400 [Advenella kashmirensis W13003]|uniref:HTH gntR-type domain-containing protein n=1 Tax=Advenella kashmirensis W13003 TaxID=1424334 RepID=V8QTS0_9BURK|nr:FCD domain-containing protein [Advenella kashmirensis]ETF02409.1 hypothetical protein W822_15400 [Advenella kashmirensis W13003]